MHRILIDNMNNYIIPINYDPKFYTKYDNTDIIYLYHLYNIPYNYDGIMSVPITIHKYYNPDQIELLGTSRYNDIPNVPKRDLEINGKRTFVRTLMRWRK